MIAACGAAHAQAAVDSADSNDIGEVIVVATRSPVAASKVGNAVSVLTDAQIAESQAIVTSDLMARLPGVGVTRNGGPGNVTGVRIRGAEPDQTLVLIDGVQINDPASTGGGFDFGNLLVGDISRIEVLRGSQSVLYGSQAIGGIVNIVTAQPQENLGGSLFAEYGAMDSLQVGAAVGGKAQRASFRLAGTFYDTDGVSMVAGGAEADGFRNSTFSGRFGYDFTSSVNLDLRAYYADGRAEGDGFPPPLFTFADTGDYGTLEQFVGYAGVNFALAQGRLRNRLAVQTTNSDRITYADSGLSVDRSGRFRGENRRYEYQGDWLIATGYTAVFGAQSEQSQMRSDGSPSHAQARQNSAYLQLQGEVTRGLTLTAGGRYDDHDTFGSHGTGQAAIAWELPSSTVLRASWGQGFKAPSLYQLFSEYANPALQPETSNGWDAGIEQHLLEGRAMVSVTGFARTSRSLISYVGCGFPADPNSLCAEPGHSTFGYYDNITRTDARGVELQAAWQLTDTFDLTANYTYTHAEDRSPESTDFGLPLLRRPRGMANATATWRAPFGLTSSLALRYVSASDDMDFDQFPAARVHLAAYTLVDLRLAWSVTDAVKLAARIENLFDENYQTVLNYGATGRAGYVSVRYDF